MESFLGKFLYFSALQNIVILMKRIFVLCIVVLFITPVLSQNDPVPDYLTAYDFPDSVKSLGLLSIHGERTTFG